MARPRRVAAKRGQKQIHEQVAGEESVSEEEVILCDSSECEDEKEEAPPRKKARGAKDAVKSKPATNKKGSKVGNEGTGKKGTAKGGNLKKGQKLSAKKVSDSGSDSEFRPSDEEGDVAEVGAESSDAAAEEEGSDSDVAIAESWKGKKGTAKGPQAGQKRKRAPKKAKQQPKSKAGKKAGKGDELEDDPNVWGPEEELDPEELVRRAGPQPQMEPAAELLMPLLPFQKEWLAWSMKQEESAVRGGILADEMGMGKTIQAISLIVTSRHVQKAVTSTPAPPAHACSHAESAPPAGAASSRPLGAAAAAKAKVAAAAAAAAKPGPSSGHLCSSPNSTGPLPAVKATLVVCPLVAVIQWGQEIARFTAPGSVKVLVYHGPKRSLDLETLSNYDVVLTTYSIVESEHRKNVMPDKEECKWCGRKFYPDRLRVHLRFFCGPGAQRSAALAKTQKKLPRSFGKGKMASKSKKVDEESDEEQEEDWEARKKSVNGQKGKGKKKAVGKGKGKLEESEDDEEKPPKKAPARNRRKVSPEELAEAVDGAIEEEQAESSKDKGSSVLHSVCWNRIVLDEAHSIKDRRCSTAKAVFALESNYKWALSGTPLQNRVGELYSLVRFLQIDPYSYYFCKKCDCKTLDYRFGKDWRKCDECGHSPLNHFCWWNKHVANPIKRWGYVQDGRRAMMTLKHKVLDSTLLRRTKLERAADLALPPRCGNLRKDAFDAREEDFYQALYTQSQSQFATYVDSGTVLNNYAHIFDLLIRLRQAVDHPYLVVHSATARADVNLGAQQQPGGGDACGICHDPPEDSVVAGCGHTFCRTCMGEYVTGAGGEAASCPSCSKPLTVDLTGTSVPLPASTAGPARRRKSILNRVNLDNFQSSTKIEALREEIALMVERDPSAKALVFSQFTSMLDLISFRLQKTGVRCVKLDGSMSMEARDKMITQFTHDPDVTVFLMSLKAGGVALNLTVASQVFLMDPWWNPAVEQQAQDRIHRLGQYKPIKVTRFVIEDTIEERILKLQEKKQLVFEGTVGGSAEALGRLTEDDLRFLFSS